MAGNVFVCSEGSNHRYPIPLSYSIVADEIVCHFLFSRKGFTIRGGFSRIDLLFISMFSRSGLLGGLDSLPEVCEEGPGI